MEEVFSSNIFAAVQKFYDIVLIILFVFGVITGILATNQGKRFWLWFWVGFLLGPFGLFLTLRVVGLRPRPPAVTCRSCGMSVRTRGSRCPGCGKLLAGASAIRRPGWDARQPERRSSCVARSKQDAGGGPGYRRRPTNCRLAVANHCVSDHYLTLAPNSRLDAGLGGYRRTCTVRTLE